MFERALFLVLGLGVLGVSIREPAWGLFLLFASTFIDVPTEMPGGFTVFSSEVLFAVVAAVWVVKRGGEYLSEARQRPLLAASLAFMAVLAASAVSAESRGEAVKGLVRWAEFVGVLLMASDAGLRGIPSRRAALAGLAVAVLVLSLHAVWDAQPWRVHLDNEPGRMVLRLPGGSVVWRASSYTHPNMLAFLLFPGVALFAAAWVAGAGGAAKWASLLLSSLGGATIMLTWSRTGLLTLGVVAAAVLASCPFAPDARRRVVRFFALACATALLVRALAAPAALSEQSSAVRATFGRIVRIAGGAPEGKTLRATNTAASQSVMAVSTLNDRKLMAETAGRIARDHPLLGAGPGNWRAAAPSRAASGMDAAGLVHHPHNLWLLVLAETGIMGLAAFLAVLVSLFWRVPWRAGGTDVAYRFAFAGILAGFAAFSLFDVPLTCARGMPLACLLGYLRWAGAGRNPT